MKRLVGITALAVGLIGGFASHSLSQVPAVSEPPIPSSDLPIAPIPPEITPSAIPSNTPAPDVSPTAQPSATPTTEPTVMPTPVATATPEPTATPTPEPTATPTPEPTPEPTSTPKSDYGPSSNEFHEVSLIIRPGWEHSLTRPAGFGKNAFTISTGVSFFISKWVGIYAPYTYSRYGSTETVHTAGAGPIFRYLDYGYLRGHASVEGLYARALDTHHFGLSFGGDLLFGFKDMTLRPFFGPFFRYETIYLPGDNLRCMQMGLSLTFTNLTDF